MNEIMRQLENAIDSGQAIGYKIDSNYYQQHKERIDRFTTEMGKDYYDMPQLEIIGDIFKSNWNATKSTFNNYLANSMHHEWVKLNNFANVDEPTEYIKKAHENHIEYKDIANTLREEYRKKIDAEPNATQKFSMSIFAETLRTATDPRQLPLLVGVNVLSPVVAGYIGATSTAGVIGTSAVLNGFENLVEDNIDSYFTNDRFQTFEENFFSFAGGAGSALLLNGFGHGLKAIGNKIDRIHSQKVTKQIVDQVVNDASKKIDGVSMANKGDTTVADYNNVNGIKENLKVMNEYKGTQGAEEDITKKYLIINGVARKDIDDKTILMMNKLISEPDIDIFKSGKDISDFLVKDKKGKGFLSLISEVRKTKALTEDETNAFDFFIDLLDDKKITDVRYDLAGVLDEVNVMNSEVRSGYNPMYEDSKTQLYSVDEETFKNVKSNIKHNYKDFPKGKLLSQLEKDGIIPRNAKIKYAKGYLHKAKNDVNTSSKPNIEFEYELNGRSYHGEMVYSKEKGYSGNLYELDKTATKETKINITPKKPVKNIVDDVNGTPEPIKPVSYNDIKSRVFEYLGIDKKYDANTDDIGEVMEELEKHIGGIIRRKYNLNSIEEVIDFYKKKYDLDFEYTGKKSMRALGQTVRIITNGETVEFEVRISDAIEDLDTQIGVLRHEIQHLLDYKNYPEFDSKSFPWFYKENNDGLPMEEALNNIGKGHFAEFENEYFELSYILKNAMDNIITEDGINTRTVEILNLEVPENPTKTDMNFVKTALDRASQEKDTGKALAVLRKELSTYTKWRDDINEIFFEAQSTAQATTRVKEWLETNLFIPFEKVHQQTKGMLAGLFEMKDKQGNILSLDKLLDLFEKEKTSLSHYIFRWDSKLPDNLKYLEEPLKNVKNKIYSLMKDMTQGYNISVEEMVDNFLFDQNLSVEKFMQREELLKFIDENNYIDLDRLLRGDRKLDDVTKLTIPKRLINIRDRFADENFEFFKNSVEVFKSKLDHKKKLTRKQIRDSLDSIKDCMTQEEKIKFVKKYNLEKDRKIKEYIQESNFYDEVDESKIQQNLLESKKRNAKFMYSMDLMSKRGDIKYNNYLGTHLNRFGRFERYLNEDMILTRENLRKLVDKNRTSDKTAMGKFIEQFSSASAMKEILPQGGFNSVENILERLQEYSSNAEFQTYSKDILGSIDERIGEKLGRVTKPPRTVFDKFIDNFVHFSNKISLTGLKALGDFAFEIPTMSRANVMLYGGAGNLATLKHIIETVQILKMNKELLDKFDKKLGKRWENSVSIKYISSVLDDLDDYTGARAERIRKYGSKADQFSAAIDKVLNKANLYGHTQKLMKLTAFTMSAENLRNIGKFKDIDDLFKNHTSYMKKLFRDVGIDDLDYHFIKKLDEIEDFRELNLFSEVDVYDFIKKADIEDKIKRTLSDDEFEVLRKNISGKITKLYDKIVNDISPTETNASMRYNIEMIRNPVHRIFMKLMANFKTSINEQWRRAFRDLYYSNLNDGKFDWNNKIYQKRFLRHIIGLGGVYAGFQVIFDPGFYADPIQTIKDKVDDVIDNPGSHFWQFIDSQFNSWALINGAAVARRPITITQQLLKGDVDKATENLIKLGFGTSNVNLATGVYNKFKELEE